MSGNLGWHVISGEGLLGLLRRAANGEDPDMVYAEEYVNAERERVEPISPDRYDVVARKFHEEYEARAPQHGWETQKRSRVAWEDVPQENRDMMVSVVMALMRQGVIEFGPKND